MAIRAGTVGAFKMWFSKIAGIEQMSKSAVGTNCNRNELAADSWSAVNALKLCGCCGRMPIVQGQRRSGWSGLMVWFLAAVLMAAGLKPVHGQTPQQEFDRAVEALRKLTAERNEAGLKFSTSSRDESENFRAAWDSTVAKGMAELEAMENAALEMIRGGGEVPDTVLGVLVRMQRRSLRDGKFTRSYEIGKLLEERLPDMAEVKAWLAAAAVCTDHFDDAEKYQSALEGFRDTLPLEILRLFDSLPDLKTKYQRELAFREKEKQLDDLPRVVLKTTKGRIEIELYENEAPETVGNFISLVESQFYTDLLFHRVISAFMAQGGGMTPNNTAKDVDYTIYDECAREDARHHFYGSVSMVKAPFPNSGQNQFFITFAPTPHLDGSHTVFGRVISGFDALEALARTHKIEEEKGEVDLPSAVPDRIVSATVLRKRDHEYRPRKVQEGR
jgi:cyclophilin family peptidyl-prolyl cis-trans isomerase